MSSTDNTTRKINGLHLEDGMNEVLLTATPCIQQTSRRRPAATIPRLHHVRLLHHRPAQLTSATRPSPTGWHSAELFEATRAAAFRCHREPCAGKVFILGEWDFELPKKRMLLVACTPRLTKNPKPHETWTCKRTVTNYKAWCLCGCWEGKLNA